jgi:competence protein ComEA
LSIKRLIRDYFGFSKTQTNGFLVLIPLMFVLLMFPTLYHRLTRQEYDKFETDQVKLDSLVALWNERVKRPAQNDVVIELSSFDPNTASIEDMTKLGLGNGLAARIENYRSAGGQFRVKSDLKKIYGLSDSLYQNLAAYILLPDKIVKPAKLEPKKPLSNSKVTEVIKKDKEVIEPEVFIIELNTADSLAFRKLRGIGPSYSGRIVKYRELLGGFTSIDQIGEVYGVSDSLYQTLVPYLTLSESFVPKQLNINLATFKELNAHPYISYEQTKAIMNGKSKFGKFNTPEDLKRLDSFDSIQIAKLTPYLKFK